MSDKILRVVYNPIGVNPGLSDSGDVDNDNEYKLTAVLAGYDDHQ